MAQNFDVGEVFEMAVDLERNGAAFYRQAAEKARSAELLLSLPEVKANQGKAFNDLRRFYREASEHDNVAGQLLRLADMEEGHEKIVNDLRRKLSADNPDYFDPTGEAAAYLKSVVDNKVSFKHDLELSSMESILREAIMAEQDSVVFYFGLKAMLSNDAGKMKIEAIIRDEMEHIRILSEYLTG